jgi:putative addiction module killer protein
MTPCRIVDYVTEDGRVPFKLWLSKLADRQARARILTRLQRLTVGDFGDCKALRDGVFELRIDFGPGYRVYYARAGDTLIVLLAGGDKRGQQVDIETAVGYWQEWKRRSAP